MNNFKVETYKNPVEFYSQVGFNEHTLHIVATSSLSMFLKSMNNFKNNKNYIWTFSNLEKAIFTNWNNAIINLKMKIIIRGILEEICIDSKILTNLLKDIDGVLSDFKVYMESKILNLSEVDGLSYEFNIVRKAYNIFISNDFILKIYKEDFEFDTDSFINRLNSYYNSITGQFKAEKTLGDIKNIDKVYFYNLTYINPKRFKFFKDIETLGIEVIFRIPDEGFIKPWRETYSFVKKWVNISGNEENCLTNKYTDYLLGLEKENYNDPVSEKIKFRRYLDPGDFKVKLDEKPIWQSNDELINWAEKNNKDKLLRYAKINNILYKTIREYITFSKEDYNDIFNGTIINYKDKLNNYLYYSEGKFFIGLYNCKWDNSKERLLMDYNSFCNCILSGWIELKSKNGVISGKNALDLLNDLIPYMRGVDSFEEIINRLYRLTYLQDFCSTFDNYSKEKSEGDFVREFLHNPLKSISYSENNRYSITVKQLIELSKRLKRYIEELIPKDNLINIKDHKYKLLNLWKNVSESNKNILKNINFEICIRKESDFDEVCTINEVRDYMNIILNENNMDEDSELTQFNFIKVFEQIEGIMVNGTKEVYITDLSEKSINKYIKTRKQSLNYSNNSLFLEDLNSYSSLYEEEELYIIKRQLEITNNEMLSFIKYYIGALLSYSKALLIEFSWIENINSTDQESSIYKILKFIYKKEELQKKHFIGNEEIVTAYKNNLGYFSNLRNNNNTLKDIYENMGKDLKINIHNDIAPPAWLDLDLCPKKFFYSGILNLFPIYQSDFHQRIMFSIIGKLLKSQNETVKDVEKFFYYLFPQWNKTTKDNMIETAFKREVRKEYKFKNIYFPYHIKDIFILRSKIHENGRRIRRNAYRERNIRSEKYFKEFIKDEIYYDDVKYIKGTHCDMCAFNLICLKGEFSVERVN